MILVLKGADFSAKNIGHIDLPIEIDTDIATLLQSYSKPLTNENKLAVQKFIKTLRTSGVMAKLRGLYLPILAGQLNESFVNCIDGDTHPVTYSPNGDSYQITDYGVRRYASGNEIVLDVVSDLSGDNWSIFALANSEDVSQLVIAPRFGSNGMLVFSKSELKSTGLYISNTNSTTNGGESLNSKFIDAANVVNLKDSFTLNTELIVAVSFMDGHVYEYETSSGNGIKDNKLASAIGSTVGVFKLDTSTLQRMYASQSIIALGEGLTPEQIIALGNASKELRASLVR